MNDKYFCVIEAPREDVKANFPGLNKKLYEIACPGTDGEGMSLESIADELCISGTLHSRQAKVMEMLEEIEPSAFCHAYVSDNGPAHILIDAYFAKKAKCQEFADKLNQCYARLVAMLCMLGGQAQQEEWKGGQLMSTTEENMFDEEKLKMHGITTAQNI